MMPQTMNPLSVWFYVAVAVILAGESYVVVRLVGGGVRSRFRMWLLLLLMNILTWTIAIAALWGTSGGLGGLLVVEIFIILVEAVVIMSLANSSWVSPGSPAPITLRKGMRASIIGNVVSWFIGFVMMVVPIY